MNKNDNKTQIERLLKKADIKEINGINCTEEVLDAIDLLLQNPVPEEVVDTYVSEYTTLALSLLEEPLSDIPMGQVMQFTKLVNKEYETFKDMFKNKCESLIICQQFWRLNAASEYLSDIIMKLSDKEEFIETPELNEIKMELVKVNPDDDISVYTDAIEKTFEYYDAVIKLLMQGVETNNVALMSVAIFYLTTTNLYNHYTIEYMEEEDKKAPV